MILGPRCVTDPHMWLCVQFSSPTMWWIQSTQSPDCKRTLHLHLKNSLCTHCETCCYLEQPLYLSVIPLSLALSRSGWESISLFYCQLIAVHDCLELYSCVPFIYHLLLPLSSPPFIFLPSLFLSKWKQIICCGFSSTHWYLSAFSLCPYPQTCSSGVLLKVTSPLAVSCRNWHTLNTSLLKQTLPSNL